MITFQNPHLLFLLLGLIPLGALFYFSFLKRKTISNLFHSKELFFKETALYFGLAFILIILALAEPNEEAEVIQLPQEELYFLLDTSSSMSVTDTPSRSSRFEEAVSFIHQNLNNKSLKGLIVFNETAEIAIPLTFDTSFFQLELEQLKVEKGQSTDISAPLKKLIDISTSTNTKKAILVSDGENQSKEPLKPLISALKKKGFDLRTKIVGSTQGGSVPGTTYEGGKAYSKANPAILDSP